MPGLENGIFPAQSWEQSYWESSLMTWWRKQMVCWLNVQMSAWEQWERAKLKHIWRDRSIRKEENVPFCLDFSGKGAVLVPMEEVGMLWGGRRPSWSGGGDVLGAGFWLEHKKKSNLDGKMWERILWAEKGEISRTCWNIGAVAQPRAPWDGQHEELAPTSLLLLSVH